MSEFHLGREVIQMTRAAWTAGAWDHTFDELVQAARRKTIDGVELLELPKNASFTPSWQLPDGTWKCRYSWVDDNKMSWQQDVTEEVCFLRCDKDGRAWLHVQNW